MDGRQNEELTKAVKDIAHYLYGIRSLMAQDLFERKMKFEINDEKGRDKIRQFISEILGDKK